MTTHTHERRRHPRLPMHLSIAKMVDFQCDGLEQPAPAVLVDLSAGGLRRLKLSELHFQLAADGRDGRAFVTVAGPVLLRDGLRASEICLRDVEKHEHRARS